ncbi:MAG: methylated-DNA--[protein]-cysteine S-methyltransferase [Malacoplasma sp.]
MIYSSIILTPIGHLMLSTDENSVLSISLISEVVDYYSFEDKTLPKIMINLQEQIIKYFNKELTTFNVALNFENTSEFQKNIYTFLMSVKYGDLITYKEIGNKLNSRAYRVIGTNMRKNPFPIIIPWHRVILSSKKIGKYSLGGIETKKFLLDLEGSMNKKN